MRFSQIINSLLETDMYKFSMGQVMFHRFSGYSVTWTFNCRNKSVQFTSDMIEEIREQLKAYCSLRFTEDELTYLKSILWIDASYVDYLRLWNPRYSDFVIEADKNSPFGMKFEAHGTWLNTTMYEIASLAIINEVYFRMAYNYNDLLESAKTRFDKKFDDLMANKYYLGIFSEFGMRRRLSGEFQDYMVERLSHLNDTMKCASTFIGTSNVYLAKKYGIKPVGTMAHEYIMCIGQGNHKYNPAYSNYFAMQAWIDEYKTLNGIALTDTITTDCFLKDFDLTFATLFSGVRHDSGNPYIWGDKMIEHYNTLGIDPKTKTLLFSDSLDFEKADNLFRYFTGRAKVAFGIGTYLSNDTDVDPLNIVMKVTKCNGYDVAKISDDVSKGMCKNPEYVDYLNRSIKWRMEHDH